MMTVPPSLIIFVTVMLITLMVDVTTAVSIESLQSLQVPRFQGGNKFGMTTRTGTPPSGIISNTTRLDSGTLRSGASVSGGNKKRARSHEESMVIKLQRRGGGSSLLGEITVGTPAKRYLVDFDTGSSTLWLFGVQAKTSLDVVTELVSGSGGDSGHENGDGGDGGEFVHSYYDKAGSGSYKPWYFEHDDSSSEDGAQGPLEMEIPYGDGDTVEGEFASETFQVGKLRVVENAVVGIANKITCATDITEFDGIFGLGIDEEHEGTTPPFIHMADSDLLVNKSCFRCIFLALATTERLCLVM